MHANVSWHGATKQEFGAISKDWTSVLRQGEQAIRARLSKQSATGAEPALSAASSRPKAPERTDDQPVAHGVQSTGIEMPPIEAGSGSIEQMPRNQDPERPFEPQGSQTNDLPSAHVEQAPPEPLRSPFAELTAADRIPLPTLQRDRTFLIALAIVIVMHAGALVATIRLGDIPADAANPEKIGQIEKTQTVSVELVEEPSAEAKTKRSQMGEDAPSAPPLPETELAPPEPENQPPEPEKPEPKKAEKPLDKPAEKPLTVDDFDISMDAYAKAVDAAQAERRRQRANPRTADASRIQGIAAQGRLSPYVRSVQAAISRSKPQVLLLTRGSVYIEFVLNREGKLVSVRLTQSSGDPLLDQAAMDHVKGTKYPVPPADVTQQELNYQIHFSSEDR